MRFLVDTHVLLWLLGSPERVPDAARSALAERANTLLVSAASAMEVATKVRLGKLPAGRALVDAWAARLAEISAEELPLSCGHALLAGSMVWDHRDPFDRLPSRRRSSRTSRSSARTGRSTAFRACA